MRGVLLVFAASAVFAQQPILYFRTAVNAASYAPFGLPNGAIARGSVFSVFGENLGPAQSPSLAFPLSATLGGVSISVTQSGVVTQAYPIYVSAGQINAIMPSTVTAGLATLRLTYQSKKSNAVTIQIGDSSPGIFSVSSGGYGPGVVYNYVSASSQPINSLQAPATPGQVLTIWGTGLGPVKFADNVAPTPGNVATAVTVTIGGQPAAVTYSGRAPCCAGIDQIVATVPKNAPLGCWVPVSVKAAGVVSNTATMAIAAAGANSCSDPGNPLSKVVETAGTQAFIHLERIDQIDNVRVSPAATEVLDHFYARYFTRPNSPYNFDPYMSFPPAGTCLVHQAAGNSANGNSLRGALPPSESLNPQPNQTYSNGTQPLKFSPAGFDYSTAVGGTINSAPSGVNLLTSGTYTIDPGGPNQAVIPIAAETPPSWTRPSGIIVIPRNQPLNLAFTPGDAGSPTAIVIYSYAAGTNSTVEVECVAAAGASSFTIAPDTLANLPPSYLAADGSYTNLIIGSLGLNRAVVFNNGLAANGVLLISSWVAQTAVIQ